MSLTDLGDDPTTRPIREWHELHVDPKAVERLDLATRAWQRTKRAWDAFIEGQHMNHAARRGSL